jgi:ferredoxin--NADP+ reductase
MSNFYTETVLSVHHWTDRLFSFTATRSPAFRFLSGQFTMIGLEINGRPLLRAYSMVSAAHEENLEFLSIKVPDGPLTSHLQHLSVGDTVLVGRKPTGTLIQDNLLPGETLYMLATGTGLAPFMSIVKDPETYERFKHVVVVHGCRLTAELAYREFLTETLPQDEFIGEQARAQLLYYPTVTRENFVHMGRLTDLMRSGQLPRELGLPPLDRAGDRVMLCGSPEMLADMAEFLKSEGFVEGNHSEPGDFVIEKAFVEK